MSDAKFVPDVAPLSLAEIAELTGAVLAPGFDAGLRIANIAALDRAAPGDLSFIDSVKYVSQLRETRASACLAGVRFEKQAPPHVAVLRVREPYRAFITVARKLFPGMLRPTSVFATTGIAPGASVHPSARLEAGVIVDPGVVIGPRAEIGSGTLIAANAVIGPAVRIGRDCAVGAGTSIIHALVGDRVIIHAGCRIGQDGFGFLMGAGGHLKVPQIGRVIIQDDVEIGAGSTIDRGAIRDTVIGEGTKIDNLVQIGHNVVIGRHCVIVAQTGISGSSTLEDFVALGARVGVTNHVTIGEGAQIAAISIVGGDVPPGARWGGTPAKPVKQWLREVKVLEHLAQNRRGSDDGDDEQDPAA
ncbi:MAG: UDP-3-O-(3-hydroxymyristoyl)glucosamine N-acyltransferase [Xanthobacteraceae bacterium]|nr:UDP-3-O-(3-hydroxymyristoyl)glucosamine N-acyltransferase [Xanthobacteraceae bacterium]